MQADRSWHREVLSEYTEDCAEHTEACLEGTEARSDDTETHFEGTEGRSDDTEAYSEAGKAWKCWKVNFTALNLSVLNFVYDFRIQ